MGGGTITPSDRAILRERAHRALELAQTDGNRRTEAEWRRHNMMQPGRPMVHIEVDTFAGETIQPMLRCEGAAAREIEYRIIHGTANRELFGDDKPAPDHFPVHWRTWFKPFGFDIGRSTALDDSGRDLGHRFHHVIADLERDYELLGPSEFGVDEAGTAAFRALAEDAIGDILPVQMRMDALYAVPTQHIVHLMGMEPMCLALYDCPELFAQMMDRLADDYLAYFKLLEDGGYLLPTAGPNRLNQGSFCYTDELPESGPVTAKQCWGFMDSQETVSISPAMFADCIFPAYRKIAGAFGLLSYGCCEPVHAIWDCLSQLGHLRKVSISPWCDEALMGERLRGSGILFHRKPSPNFLGVNESLDEDAVRAHFKATADAARGCQLEITQRDVYTVHGNPAKVRRYVELIRECVDR